jgi:hypothetical protein
VDKFGVYELHLSNHYLFLPQDACAVYIDAVFSNGFSHKLTFLKLCELIIMIDQLLEFRNEFFYKSGIFFQTLDALLKLVLDLR